MSLERDTYANAHTGPLATGEAIVAQFPADRDTYIRDHVKLAAVAMALGMAVLWFIGNPHIWTGAIGGLAAVIVRGAYIASDELALRWDLTDRRLLGPGSRAVPLAEIAKINVLGSAVQVVTLSGDKYLIKYQADRDATHTRIQAAQAGRRDG